jgi:copper(I)-binding protein
VTAASNRILALRSARRPQGVDVKAEQVTVRRVGIALAVAAALLTSGCAAGQHAGTADESPTLNGVNASVGTMLLRALVIEPPAGATTYYAVRSDATVKLVLVNTGTAPDQLTSITSPAFDDWGAFATTAAADAVVNADAAALAPKSSAAPSKSAQNSGSSAPSGTVTATPLPTPSKLITIEPGSRTSFGTPDSRGTLLLIHATKLIYPGTTIEVTFTFANAGSVTVVVPIALSLSPRSSVVPEPTSSGGEG